jgi:hypothetical protein
MSQALKFTFMVSPLAAMTSGLTTALAKALVHDGWCYPRHDMIPSIVRSMSAADLFDKWLVMINISISDTVTALHK